MTDKEKETRIAVRPSSPTTGDRGYPKILPYELDPELAQIKLAELMIHKLGTPSIVSKPFVVRYGIFHALNHTDTNPTGYDCSGRLHVYQQVAAQSVNIDGKYFTDFWAYLMKPKYIINGMAGLPSQFNQEQGGAISRFIGWIRGKKPEQQQQQGG
jgi:hypothetical protein